MNVESVRLGKDVLPVLVRAAIQGYQGRRKEQRLGILLGRIERKVAIVQHATIYKGGTRARSGVTVDTKNFTRRVRELSAQYNSQFLGTFHSHNEVPISEVRL